MDRSGGRRQPHVPAWGIAVVVLVLSLQAAQRQWLSIPSPSMGRSRRALVVVPSSYRTGNRRYPVVYLLHGYGSSPAWWLRVARLGALADSHEVILVCPDGGRASWWLDSPVRPRSRLATHVADEVVAEVDRRFRTIRSRAGRGLVGSSMGGHGALTILATRFDTFCAAGSVSGIPDLTACGERWGLPAVLGPLNGNEQQWRSHSFIGMTDRLRSRRCTVVMVWGRDDWAAGSNRRARDHAVAAGLAVEWNEASGGHTPEFVRGQLPAVLGRVAALVHEKGENNME